MEKREIEYIGETLYQKTLEDKLNGKWTEHDIELETEMYKELNALGFNFYWYMQISPLKFTKKDKAIVPIFKKYVGKFDSEALNDQLLNCMAVPGLYEATEFYLEQYKKLCGKSSFALNTVCNSLYRIKDPYHKKEYMDILNDEKTMTTETRFIVELIGRLKIKEAIPRLIQLLDFCIILSKEDMSKYCVDKFSIRDGAIVALGFYKDSQYISHIEKFLDSRSATIKCAMKSIKMMGGEVEKFREGRKVKWRLAR